MLTHPSFGNDHYHTMHLFILLNSINVNSKVYFMKLSYCSVVPKTKGGDTNRYKPRAYLQSISVDLP